MKVLVTGAAGFVGSAVSQALLREGHFVVAVDSFFEGLYPQSGRRRRFQQILEEHGPMIMPLEIDVLELQPHHLDSIDAVANLAAFPGLRETWRQPEMVWRQNVATVQHLARLAVDQDLPLVHASTSSVYGRVAKGVSSSLPNPVSPYGISKLAAENILEMYGSSDGLRSVSLRLFSVYGPGQRSDMAFYKAIDSILSGKVFTVAGDGRQSRANTFVSDAAAAFVSALRAMHDKRPLPPAIDICGPEVHSLRQALEVIENLYGESINLRFEGVAKGDQLSTQADTEAALKHLYFRPETSFREGMEIQFRWMAEYKDA